MSNVTRSTISCGIKLLQDLTQGPVAAVKSLSDPETQVPDVQTGLGTLKCTPVFLSAKKCEWPGCTEPNCCTPEKAIAALVLFSDRVGANGAILADYIRRNKLGKVSESVPVTNPNSAREIILYTWELPSPKEYFTFIDTPEFKKEYKEMEAMWYKDGRRPAHG